MHTFHRSAAHGAKLGVWRQFLLAARTHVGVRRRRAHMRSAVAAEFNPCVYVTVCVCVCVCVTPHISKHADAHKGTESFCDFQMAGYSGEEME